MRVLERGSGKESERKRERDSESEQNSCPFNEDAPMKKLAYVNTHSM